MAGKLGAGLVNMIGNKKNEANKKRIDQMEKQYPPSTCAYCLAKKVMMVTLPCQHQYCAACLKILPKITKVKKNSLPLTEMLENEDALKCPKCATVHIVGEEEYK